jgi:hypothetical protein
MTGESQAQKSSARRGIAGGVRVQVVLEPSLVSSDTSLKKLLTAITDHGLLANHDQPLLRRFGILRGEVTPSRIAEIASLDGVKAVDLVERKRIRSLS